MSRPIDADAVKGLIRSGISVDTYADQDYVCELVDDIPTIDAVSVVRCKECKYAHMTYDGLCKYCDTWKDDDGNLLELYLDGDYYCADGEREGE